MLEIRESGISLSYSTFFVSFFLHLIFFFLSYPCFYAFCVFSYIFLSANIFFTSWISGRLLEIRESRISMSYSTFFMFCVLLLWNFSHICQCSLLKSIFQTNNGKHIRIEIKERRVGLSYSILLCAGVFSLVFSSMICQQSLLTISNRLQADQQS